MIHTKTYDIPIFKYTHYFYKKNSELMYEDVFTTMTNGNFSPNALAISNT